MRELRFVTLVALAVFSVLFGSLVSVAGGGSVCVTEQCEGKSRTCVETLYAETDTCMKAGRKKCDTVPMAEKFNCLRDALKPCALTRNDKREHCLTEFRACYVACGPLEGKRADFWCVADTSNSGTAAFCAADPASDKPTDACAKVFAKSKAFKDEPFIGGMTCDSM